MIDQKQALLPIGIQNFEELRKGGYHYVDKTDMVWQIANEKKFNFLSRPRRFGKSLLTSTLHYYFEGRKDLFEGLKIMDIEKEWPKCMVFHFDFSGINTAEDLLAHLTDRIKAYEKALDVKEPKTILKDRMFDLMQRGYDETGHQVAVLVDEYDAPLQHTLFDNDEHEGLKNVYRNFFPCFKTGSHLLKCLFLTGIMKFTQLSLFSVLNTVTNLSFDERYATVCGITKNELKREFDAELDWVARKMSKSKDDILNDLKSMYDGYHFVFESEGVFNPYSIINALADKKLGNYWISSGGNQLLSNMLENYGNIDDEFEDTIIDDSTLEESDANSTDLNLFLYQSGYLTIKDYAEGVYTLGFPNEEVRQALYKIVLPNAVAKSSTKVNNSISRIKLALGKLDMETVMQNVEQIVAGTPYAQDNSEKAMENRFQFILKHIFHLCGCRMEEERQMAAGRIDLVAHHPRCIIILELKMTANGGLDAAEDQIIDRSYIKAYKAEPKLLFEVPISFSTQKRMVTGFNVNRIK